MRDPAGPRVLVLGDLMRDIVVRAAGPVRRGTDQRAAIRLAPGGSGANQAAWLAHCGVAVRFLGCVAREDKAAEAAQLEAAGVEAALAGHPDLPTGTLIALVDPDGERSFLTDRGANDGLDLASLEADPLDGITHLHLSGYALVGAMTRAAALSLLARCAGGGIPVSVDPGSSAFVTELGSAAVLGWTAPAALCIANGDEAEALTGEATSERQLAALAAHYGLAILKRGPGGAQAMTRGGLRADAAAPHAQVIDTIGAGDAFLAGFLAARLGGAPLETALAAAVGIAARAVALLGGRPPA